MVGAHIPKKNEMSKSSIFQNNMFEVTLMFPWIIWSVLVSPKIKINGVGAQGHARKSRNHRKEGVDGSPISTS